MSLTIWHNPRCSKSRMALELLKEKGYNPEIVHYLETPPSYAVLEGVLHMLGKEPREIMRTGESVYKNNGLENPSLSRESLIQAMVDHPILIERPIVISKGKAALGRPPENVFEIL